MDLNSYPAPHPQAASRVVEGAAVVVLADSGEVNVYNSVGTRIWELADGSRSVQQIIDMIVDEFDVATDQAAAEAQEFLQTLVEARALVMHSPPADERRPK